MDSLVVKNAIGGLDKILSEARMGSVAKFREQADRVNVAHHSIESI
jgi:hypothetical protein